MRAPAVNDPPTDLSLSSSSVKENAASGTLVGLLSAVDPDAGDSHTYTLVNNAGGRFGISGNQLVVANGSLLNFEAGTSHNITVRVTDSGGETYDESFTISVQNVNEVVSFDVQRGAMQRSYIRFLDRGFRKLRGPFAAHRRGPPLDDALQPHRHGRQLRESGGQGRRHRQPHPDRLRRPGHRRQPQHGGRRRLLPPAGRCRRRRHVRDLEAFLSPARRHQPRPDG